MTGQRQDEPALTSRATAATRSIYGDGDWISPGCPGTSAFFAAPDPGEAAARLLAHADRLAQLAERTPPAAVEVVGDGLVAEATRNLLGVRSASQPLGRPSIVIDCSGEPTRLLDAVERVADLGTIVLGGESLGRRLDVELYVHVHRRGLRLVGAPRLSDVEPSVAPTRIEWALARLVDVPAGTSLPVDASWLAVIPAAH